MTSCDSVDHKRRACNTVAGGKYAVPGCCQRVRVDGNGLQVGQADIGIIRDEGQAGSLSD